jgi:hypothetical protein
VSRSRGRASGGGGRDAEVRRRWAAGKTKEKLNQLNHGGSGSSGRQIMAGEVVLTRSHCLLTRSHGLLTRSHCLLTRSHGLALLASTACLSRDLHVYLQSLECIVSRAHAVAIGLPACRVDAPAGGIRVCARAAPQPHTRSLSRRRSPRHVHAGLRNPRPAPAPSYPHYIMSVSHLPARRVARHGKFKVR